MPTGKVGSCRNCGRPVKQVRLPNGLTQKFCPLPPGRCRKEWRRKYLAEVYRLGVEAIKARGGWDGEGD